MTSLNERAWIEVEQTITGAEALGITIERRAGGTLVLDAGVAAPGGLEAGLALARIGMAGLGSPSLEYGPLSKGPWPSVVVRSDRPWQACFLSQAAHWSIDLEGLRGMGSGPGCLLNADLEVGRGFDFQERSACAVLVLETRTLPDEAACRALAHSCGVAPDRLALVVAPTACLAGSVQIGARALETGLHKLHRLDFDLRRVEAGFGRCPLASPTGSDLESLGRTNDVVFFGAQVWLALRGVTDAQLADLAPRLPASTSPSYGEPFLQALKKAGGFYAIDPGLFAPSEVTLVSLDSGAAFHAGAVDQPRLEASMRTSHA